jgi:hypothetical protein
MLQQIKLFALRILKAHSSKANSDKYVSTVGNNVMYAPLVSISPIADHQISRLNVKPTERFTRFRTGNLDFITQQRRQFDGIVNSPGGPFASRFL